MQPKNGEFFVSTGTLCPPPFVFTETCNSESLVALCQDWFSCFTFVNLFENASVYNNEAKCTYFPVLFRNKVSVVRAAGFFIEMGEFNGNRLDSETFVRIAEHNDVHVNET